MRRPPSFVASSSAATLDLKRFLCLAFTGAALGAEASPPCLAPGEPIQWIADYCMLKMETDDEIAVSGCIEEESRAKFPGACAGNTHFKTRMCEVWVRGGTRAGTVSACVSDPAAMGRTVERGGVGGASWLQPAAGGSEQTCS